MALPDPSSLLPWLTAGGAAIVALWRSTASFYAIREKNRLLAERTRADTERERLAAEHRHEEREEQFAAGLRNELRADIARLTTQMVGLETMNTSLRAELHAVTRENTDLRRELVNTQNRVFQLENALATAGIPIPPDRSAR